jgi:hypothetical protein
MLEIEVRTPTIVLNFYLSVPSQLTVEGERRRLIMEQCKRRAGAIDVSNGNGDHSPLSHLVSCPNIYADYFPPASIAMLAVRSPSVAGEAIV